ncbi:MAG: pre-peptidase C-terminal domain-containing protein [Pirellulaceae bacterium]|jgi:hypothetical protein|nr:pre-peptidase C-terminal domain-containing protein [Pirellulaceae bacterium]
MPLAHLRSRPMMFESLESRRLLAFNPTGGEQELLQLVNRFRTDPRGEFSRLIATTSPLKARDPVLQVDLDYAQVNGSVLKTQLDSLKAVPPVAWNEAIYNFSAAHNAEMIASKPPQQFHSDSLARRNALLKAGVDLRIAAGEKITSENVFGFGKSVNHLFAAYVIDWEKGGPNGMRADLGHRLAIANADFEQIGSAITPFTGTGFGPQVNTQVLANIEKAPVMVVGAVFEDRNASTWYEAGEGLGNVQIVFSSTAGTFTTKSLGAGGYQVELPAGTYTATATGGGLKFAVVESNIVVGVTNVWKNIIYDSTKPPPDRLEPNNTLATASLLNGTTQTLAALSIHNTGDVDYFRLNSLGTGTATIELTFSNAAGNLDLRLLNSSGTELAKSTSATDNETIIASLKRDTTYYVQVLGSAGAKNDTYSLKVTPPAPAAPIAERDFGIVSSQKPSTTINLIANDRDPDGTASKLTAKLLSGAPASFALSGNTLTYVAPAGYSGVQGAQYTVTDDQGLTSAPGKIEIFVLNLAAERPWHNTSKAVDVNDDGLITPQDVLTIINEINLRHARPLPKAGDNLFNMFGFLDAFPDGLLTPQDALTVINALNAVSPHKAIGQEVVFEPNGEGPRIVALTQEQETAETSVHRTTAPKTTAESHDWALVSLYSTTSALELEAERRRTR